MPQHTKATLYVTYGTDLLGLLQKRNWDRKSRWHVTMIELKKTQTSLLVLDIRKTRDIIDSRQTGGQGKHHMWIVSQTESQVFRFE